MCTYVIDKSPLGFAFANEILLCGYAIQTFPAVLKFGNFRLVQQSGCFAGKLLHIDMTSGRQGVRTEYLSL